MSDVEIINKRKASIVEFENVRLLPGANRVSAEDFQRLNGLDYFQALVRRGFLAVECVPAAEEATTSDSKVASLKGLHKDEVARLVSECTSVAQLRAWLQTDGRKASREAIEARAHELLKDTKPAEVS